MKNLSENIIVTTCLAFFSLFFLQCGSKYKKEIEQNHQEYLKALYFLSKNHKLSKNEVFEEDGIRYVKINNLLWMTENLNTFTYCNGDSIPEIKPTKDWRDAKSGAWCYYNNDQKYGEMYGKLYNWYAVNDNRGLCPCGWRVASDSDFTNLVEAYGGKYISVNYLKSDTNWKSGLEGNNLSSFNAMPGGFRPTPEGGGEEKNDFDGLTGGVWWSSTRAKKTLNLDFLNKTSWGLDIGFENSYRANDGWFVGKSVRCVKDIGGN